MDSIHLKNELKIVSKRKEFQIEIKIKLRLIITKRQLFQ